MAFLQRLPAERGLSLSISAPAKKRGERSTRGCVRALRCVCVRKKTLDEVRSFGTVNSEVKPDS